MVLYSRRRQQLLLFGMLKGLLCYLRSEFKYLKLIAIRYYLFCDIACPIPLLKHTQKNLTLGFSAMMIAQESPNWNSIWIFYGPCGKVWFNEMLACQLCGMYATTAIPSGHCSSHLAESWDSMEQWLFSLCKNNKWEERKSCHIGREKEGRKYTKYIVEN